MTTSDQILHQQNQIEQSNLEARMTYRRLTGRHDLWHNIRQAMRDCALRFFRDRYTRPQNAKYWLSRAIYWRNYSKTV